MTEDAPIPIEARWLPDLTGGRHGILIKDFMRLSPDEAKQAAALAFLRLQEGGTLEFKAYDFGQMISLYERSIGVNDTLRSVIELSEGRIWDERGVAAMLLNQGYYRVWTGVVPDLQPCEMWVKAIKFKPGADIDGVNGVPQGRAGED